MKLSDSTQRKESSVTSLKTPTDLSSEGVTAVAAELRTLLADVYALYFKTKNFHWHMNGPHFRDYHLLLDEQTAEIYAMTDVIAERARKLGALTIHSVSDVAKHQRIQDNNQEFVPAQEMLTELCEDNRMLTKYLRAAHEVCDKAEDIATASLIENWVDETERRTWFLFETLKNAH
jgi:starvation-inducible DNA-binding protein